MRPVRSLLPCRHEKTTLPLRLREPGGDLAERTRNTHGMYVACLQCGAEIPYNWREMRREEPAGFGSSLRRLMSAVSEAAAESPIGNLVGYSSDSR